MNAEDIKALRHMEGLTSGVAKAFDLARLALFEASNICPRRELQNDLIRLTLVVIDVASDVRRAHDEIDAMIKTNSGSGT